MRPVYIDHRLGEGEFWMACFIERSLMVSSPFKERSEQTDIKYNFEQIFLPPFISKFT